MKRILLVLFSILVVLLNTSVCANDLDDLEMSSLLISKDQNFDNEDNLFTQLKLLEIEKEILIQKQKTYDTFLLQQENTLSKFMIIITLFGFGLGIGIGVLTFLGYRFFEKKFEDIKNNLSDKFKGEIDRKFEEIKDRNETYLKEYYVKPLEDLNTKFESLLKVLNENGIKIPRNLIEKEFIEEEFSFDKGDI